MKTEEKNNQEKNNQEKTKVPFDVVTFPDGQRFLMIPISRAIEIELREYSVRNPSVSEVTD